jgi:hypothetical protein
MEGTLTKLDFETNLRDLLRIMLEDARGDGSPG